MTLQAFFDLLNTNPIWIISYFTLIPFTALLAGWLGKGEGHISPWKYLYAVLVYLAAIPGIFAVTLNIYFFLFERRSILSTDIYTQILPILAMILTFWIIGKNIALKKVPGFGRLSGFLFIIGAAFLLMWLVDRMKILVFTMMPFSVVLLLFAIIFLLLWYGWYQTVERKTDD